MVVQKMQGSRASYIGCPKNDIRAGCPTSSKNCSLNRDVECLSVGTIIAHSFSERSAHGGSLTIAAKEGPEPHRPARRARGCACAARCWQMSQEQLADALGITY